MFKIISTNEYRPIEKEYNIDGSIRSMKPITDSHTLSVKLSSNDEEFSIHCYGEDDCRACIEWLRHLEKDQK